MFEVKFTVEVGVLVLRAPKCLKMRFSKKHILEMVLEDDDIFPEFLHFEKLLPSC